VDGLLKAIDNYVDKQRHYIHPDEKVPEGVQIKRGKRGGQYYEGKIGTHKRDKLEDNLVEFKPKYKDAIFGVRNGGYRAYVFDIGREPEAWESHRYRVQLILPSGEVGGPMNVGSNDLEEAKKLARSSVKGRAHRHLLRRLGDRRWNH
jgi:hypothetical protein